MSHHVDDGVWYAKYTEIFGKDHSEGKIVQAMVDCLTNHKAIDHFSWYTASQVFGFHEDICADVEEFGWDMSDKHHVELYQQITDFLTPVGPIDLDKYL